MELREICDLIVDCEHNTAPLSECGHPSIRTPNIGPGYFILDGVNMVSEDTYKEWTKRAIPLPGDLIMAREAPVGNVAIVPLGIQPCLGQRTLLLRPNKELVYPNYLNYLLNGPVVQALIHAKTNGATVSHLNMKDVRMMPLPKLPTMAVQYKIASILSAYDDLIENNQHRMRILEDMARSLYREWFVKFRFPGHEKVKMVSSPLGDIPEGWEVRRIQQFGAVITGKTPSKANSDFYGNDVPFVKTPDMHGNMFILGTSDCLSTAGAKSQANKMLPTGSICVSCIGTIGVVSITTENCQTNQQINAVVLSKPTSREYLFMRLQDAKQTLENLGANGATMGNVNKGKFEEMSIVFPQEVLLARYHRFVEPMFSEILNLFRKIQNLRRTRDLLLPRLMSGQIDVEAGIHE